MMISSKYWAFILFLGMFLCSAVGCGGNVQVKGKIIFSDDGSPLNFGTILFERSNEVARGSIKEDGTFVMGFEKETDGLPPGTYNVSINAVKLGGDTSSGLQMTPLVATKYSSGATSGITVTVDKSLKLPLEIKVDRFGTE
jgi:hypothetical protein